MILLFDRRVQLLVELADDAESRTQGLRGRISLAPNTGMLFVWDRPQPLTMTMRETDIALDIAFVDSSWRIASIQSVPARSEPLVSGYAQYAIEAPMGFFARNGITAGSTVSVAATPSVHLLTSHYSDAHPARQQEILTTLEQNLANPHIGKVHLFDETNTVGSDARIQRVGPAENAPRVTYRDFFNYANTYLRNEIVIIANTDIFFDDSLATLVEYDLKDRLLCLSRWDEQPGEAPVFFDHPDSQDAWIFRSPIREFECDWPLGVPACDNRLAYEAARVGIRLANPSLSIRARHIHTSRVRNYTPKQKVAGNCRSVPIEGSVKTVGRTPIVVAAGTAAWGPVGFLYK